jgi:threonine/homoserine/homoserine lactone efflux protein
MPIDLTTLGLFLLATITLNLTPGPDMLYVIARSVGQGRRAGVVSALGIGTGTLVHMFAVALGLATLLRSVPVAYDAVKYIGAAYLLYLGVRIWLSKESSHGETRLRKESYGRIFGQGIATNVLNPKVALFFLAFLPQFIDTQRGPLFWQVIFLGLLFDTSGTIVNTSVALLSGSVGNRLRGNPRLARLQRRFTGTVFVLLAARLALPEKQ